MNAADPTVELVLALARNAPGAPEGWTAFSAVLGIGAGPELPLGSTEGYYYDADGFLGVGSPSIAAVNRPSSTTCAATTPRARPGR